MPQERNESMQPWQEILAAASLLLLILAVRSSLKKRRDYKYRDAARKLELVLQPRETVKVICPQKKGRVILTSKRILFDDTKDGFTAVLIRNIKTVRGNNEKGNRTTVPGKMVSLTIKAEQEYEIRNNCEEFAAFAKQLIKKTTKKPRKKKEDAK